MISRFFTLALVALITSSFARAAHAQPAPAEVERLVTEARRLHLAEREEWHRLVHYRRSTLGGWKSEADGAGFFVAPGGRTNPERELEATLRALLAVPASADPSVDHAVCRFPARLDWLATELRLDSTVVPNVACPGLDRFWKQIALRSVTLVFSSYYLNNPSSAFGHTFLRLNKADPHASGDKQALLDFGLDFSADINGSPNAIAYAFKGIFGAYPGSFHLMPLSYKVRQYNDFESRDLWEYELDLPPRELRRVGLHLWELGVTYFDYYYASENCSYQVLTALEVANPSYHLLDRVKAYALPVDTIKALYGEPGLVRTVRFRPSLRRVFHERLAGLTSDEQASLATFVAEPSSTALGRYPVARQAAVLDAALDYVDMRYADEILYDKASYGNALKERLELARAQLGVATEPLVITPGPRDMPHRSHDSSRVGLGAGSTQAGKGFAELSWRPALHDMADAPAGYPEHASFEFLPVTLRLALPTHSVSLEDMSLVRIVSLRPIDRFDSSVSWKLRVGATRVRDSGCPECLFGIAEVGVGTAVGERVTAFFTTDLRAFGPRFVGEGSARGRLGAGPWGGIRARIADNVIAMASGDVTVLPWQHPRITWSARAQLRWHYASQLALDVGAQKTPESGDVTLSTMMYY